MNSSVFSMVLPLIIGVLLLICGFFAGWYWQQANVTDLVQVELVQPQEGIIGSQEGDSAQNKAQSEVLGVESENVQEKIPATQENCPFVGSKNSDKYHNPQSGPAKRIKEENKVCFDSESEAKEQGYTAGTL